MSESKEKRRQNPSPSSVPLDDPRYGIWGRVFLCRIPRISTYTSEYIQRYGMHSSGHGTIDQGLVTQRTSAYITINRMVELFHEGYGIGIVRQEDVKVIYEICQNYTFDWAEQITKTVYTHNAPFGELIDLDEFTEALYKHAAHMYGKEFAKTFVPEDVMRNAADLNTLFEAVDKKVRTKKSGKNEHYVQDNIYAPKSVAREKAQPKPVEEEIELPDRPTVRDVFERYMSNTGDGRYDHR